MAHELDMSNGRANMAFVGETPWHGLGETMEENASLDEWRVSAGMNWEILSSPVQFQQNPNSTLASTPAVREFTEKKVLYRSDTGLPLSVVSQKYNVVQPEHVLEFYRDLIDEAGFKMSTAGVLFQGRKFWALAEMGKSGSVKGDELNGYLLLSTACDGSMATIAQFTSVRVVCNNTLRLAVQANDGSTKPRISIPHSALFDPKKVKSALGLADNSWNAFMADVEKLADRHLTKAEELDWLINTFGNPKLELEDQTVASAKMMRSIHDLYDGMGKGSGLPSARGTAWGLVNATTEYLDFHTGHRTVDGRFDKAQFGDSANTKAAAWDNAMMLVA